ncbi:MAG: hypothetical protein RIQ52_1514 [Pseudomonadota bacterium]
MLKRGTACFWGLLAPVICTLASWPFRAWLDISSILLLYLLGVFLVASAYGRLPSVLASLLSATAFAFFYAPPIFSLAISDLKNMTGLGIMLIVANVTSNLVEELREQLEISEQREHWASQLCRLTSSLSKAHTREDLAGIAIRHIQQAFHSHAVIGLIHEAEGHVDQWICSPGGDSCVNYASSGHVASHHSTVLRGGCGVVGILVMAPDFIMPPANTEAFRAFEAWRLQISQSLERLSLLEQARMASLQAEAETLRNCLLSAISHDLRTPLTRIMGAASTLAELDDRLTAMERHEFAAAIQDEASHMTDLMTRILDMARLTAGALVLHREWNTVEEIVEGALARLKLPLEGRAVVVDIPEDLPLIQVDAVLLQQVLINLLDNAIKYTPAQTSIGINAGLEGHSMVLHVVDAGPGVPDDQREKLFEMFHRVIRESSLTGVGLGLAFCRSIMEAHGGSIVLAAAEGGGCDFILKLPVIGLPSYPQILTEHGGPDG